MQSEHCYLSKLKRGEKTLAEYVKERGAIRPEGFFFKERKFLNVSIGNQSESVSASVFSVITVKEGGNK